MKKLSILLITISISFISYSQIRIACVGNSITYGSGIEGRDSLSYPAQLQKMLGAEYHVRNFGLSGRTLLKKGDRPYWKEPLFDSAQAFNPDIVIIKLGTNDSKPFNWDSAKADFIPDYKEMIQIFQSLEAKPIVLIGIPAPVVGDNFNIRKSVMENEVMPAVKALAEELGLTMIDFYSLLINNPELLPDKIHPNAQGATLMAEEVVKVIRSLP